MPLISHTPPFTVRAAPARPTLAAPRPRSAATRVVGSANSGLGEPARDVDKLDVGVLGGTGKHPEGLFAGDVEPLLSLDPRGARAAIKREVQIVECLDHAVP